MGWFDGKEKRAQKLFRRGKYEEAENPMRKVVHEFERLGRDHKYTLDSKTYLAQALYRQGKYQESEEILCQVVQEQKRSLGEDHNDTLLSKDILAWMLYHQGKYQEAEGILRQVVQGWKRTLSEDYINTLLSDDMLEQILCQQGKYQEAEKILAQTLYQQGKYQEAEQIFHQVAQLRERSLGEDHDETLNCKHWLAQTLAEQGKYQQAQSIFQEVAQRRERTLGEDHNNTLICKQWLGKTLAKQRKYQQAQGIFHELAQRRERTLGEDHEETLNCKHWLAQTLYEQAEYQKAQRIFQEVDQQRERTLGKDHNDTLTIKHWVAQTLYQQGKFQDAQRIFQEVVNTREVILGKMHSDTVASNQWLLQTEFALSKLPNKVYFEPLPPTERQESKKTGSPFDMTVQGQDEVRNEGHWLLGYPSYPSPLQAKLSEEKEETEKRLRETIQDRDVLSGKDDEITLDQNKHEGERGTSHEVENIREENVNKQSPPHSVSSVRSQALVHDTTASSQEVQSPGRSVSLARSQSPVHDTTASSQEAQSPGLSLPPIHEAPASLQEVQSHAASQPVLHETTSISRDRLNTYFLTSTESRQPYSDSEISQISTLLRYINPSWSRVPRTYIILRTIGCLHHLEELISRDFSDYYLPLRKSSVPDCLSPKMCSLFLDSQKLILTQSMDLEKGAEGHHCHFEKGESLPFESKGILGSGGYGQVDRILSHISFREYARKRVPRKSAFGGRGVGALKGIIGEIEAMKKIKHRHIVEFVGSYTDPKYLSVIMRPVAEQDLSVYLRKAGSANHAEMRTFFGCLTAGLQFLHDHQIRHKDIKPGNILVDKGRIYLTDFGMSLDFEDATGSTTVGLVNGLTPRYCAPEVALSEPRNTSSDIWSLGVIFLEIIAVLKGRTIEWMDDFLRDHGSHQTFVRLNQTGLKELLSKLKQTGSLSDNVVLTWIQQILQEPHKSRPTAAALATSITQPSGYGRLETTFCGICCLPGPDDTDSDSSGDPEGEEFLRGFASRPRMR